MSSYANVLAGWFRASCQRIQRRTDERDHERREKHERKRREKTIKPRMHTDPGAAEQITEYAGVTTTGPSARPSVFSREFFCLLFRPSVFVCFVSFVDKSLFHFS